MVAKELKLDLIIGEAHNGKELVEFTKENQPLGKLILFLATFVCQKWTA